MRPKSLVLRALPPALLLCGASVYFACRPSSRVWALTTGTDLGGVLRTAWIAIGAIAFVTAAAAWRRAYGDETELFPKKRRTAAIRTFFAILLSLALFLLFFLLRSKNHYMGDGWLVVSLMNEGYGEMGSRAGVWTLRMHHGISRLLVGAGVESGHSLSFALVSCLSGVFYVLLSLRAATVLAQALRPEKRRSAAFLTASVLLTTGSMQLFFGYVETYAIIHLLLFLFFVEGMASLVEERTDRKVLIVNLLFLFLLIPVAFKMHMASVLAAPALLYLLLKPVGSRFPRFPVWSAILFVAVLYVLPPCLAQLGIHATPLPWITADPTDSLCVFCLPHLFFLVNILLLTVPVPLLLFVATVSEKTDDNRRAKDAGRFLAIAALSLFALAAVTRSSLGPRDWDLLSFFVPPFALWAAHRALRRLPARALLPCALLVCGLGVFFLFPWVVGNALSGAVAERTARFSLEDPRHWSGRNPRIVGLAGLMWEHGDRETAIRLYEETTKRRPDARIAQANVGIYYWGIGRFEEAKKHLKAAIELNPRVVAPHYYLASCYFNLQEGDMGEAHYWFVLSNNPDDPTAAGELGRVLMWRGEWEGAKRLLLVSHNALPDDPDVNTWLGRTCYALGERGEAIRYLKRALALDPGLTRVREILTDLEAGREIPVERGTKRNQIPY